MAALGAGQRELGTQRTRAAAAAAGVARLSRPMIRRLPLPYLVTSAVLPFILLALLIGRLTLGAAPTPLIGSAAPGFALADLDGNPVRLADLRGRPVIVNFWASYCASCVEEFPLLQSALANHKTDGLAVVGIVFQDRSEAARSFMARMKATWPAAMDTTGDVAQAYGVFAPPESFFIDRDGRIAGLQIGELSRTDLARQLETIVGKE
jgi:cytochrome c biogenesis protein CcmG, thiol:disulfide interchange protein DsbE